MASLLHQFRAHKMPDPDDLHSAISCPAIIITGSEDGAHPTSFALQSRIPGCELQVLPGGGHTSHLEQPWLFDTYMIAFLQRHKLMPAQLGGVSFSSEGMNFGRSHLASPIALRLKSRSG